MSARAAPELEAEFVEIGEQRRAERRRDDRRARRTRFDPLFAATLVNQIAQPEALQPRAYAAEQRLGVGVVVNLRA